MSGITLREKKKAGSSDELFNDMLEKVKELDPVYWAEKYINIDGKPFRISDNGWKPFVEIYRELCVNSLRKDAKPICLLKSRQIGGTILSTICSFFFLASGQFGIKNKPPIAILYCFPALEQAGRFSKTKFSSMLKSSKLITVNNKNNKVPYLEQQLDPNVSSKDSLTFKQFKGGNHIFIEGLSLTGDRVRGISSSINCYDEIASMRVAAIENSKKSLNASPYGPRGSGVQFYFGTPLKSNSYFYNLWNESSQRRYMLGCSECKQFFPLHYPDDFKKWEEIWIEDNLHPKDPNHGFIVRCPHCKFEDHKDKFIVNGKWIDTSPNGQNARNQGFQINQLFIPGIPRQKIIDEKPENSSNATERGFVNEVLGEFFDASNVPITKEEIDNKCGDRSLKLFTKFTRQENVKVIAGFDWGQKVADEGGDEESARVGKSFTCCTVVKTNGKDILDVIWVEKFKKNTPEYKIARVEEIIRVHSVDHSFGDIGFANDLCHTLQMKFGEKFIPMRGLGALNKKFRYVDDIFPKTIEFDHQYVLETFFDTLKKGHVKLPYGNYEHINWFVESLASMEIKSTLDRYGNTNLKYVKGSTPNDGLMSLLYCFIGHKFLQTSGFTNLDPRNQKDISKKDGPPVLLGKVSGWKGY